MLQDFDVAHHVLDPRVVLEAINREVLPVAGMLEAAVWHFRHQRDMGIYPDAPEIEVTGHPHGPPVVACPDAGSQAVLDPIGPLQRFAFVLEPLNSYNRPEYLLLYHFIFLAQAGYDRRRKAVSTRPHSLAPG